MKIMIDSGHGPETKGKRSPDGRLREFHFNSQVADEAKKQLMACGHTVIFSHLPDRDVPLHERTALANRLKVDLFVSIHANAWGTAFNASNGIETFTYLNSPAQTKRLGSFIHQALLLSTGRKDRGQKQADFAVLRDTRMPAVLIECGFMTNLEELALLKSEAYRKRCARAIAFGIDCYSRN
ncbi:N-acetylmuramoyl-L-alanine amidase family protein [Planococcus shixiaomingii]|uniref:N-acetylmuramoyl-L-alanine amidase family protein n=1 Tax=Planococcus shixiaomingii TaxID=3058393 RepID=UPI0026370F1B|nr:N-acetylmuramoyl-L-alanine amidase [Planococcus sp. N022]WKA55935.1 N-acetylmuramoyl-L-alanine amidase [Planococcus sp. N022]